MTKKEIFLRVQEADRSHTGANIVTLDMRSKEELGITSGDIVEIEGTKKTAAIVWPARSEDEGKSIIKMDSLIRHNSGVGIGDKVAVRKASYKDAKKIILAPIEQIRIIASGYERILKRDFIGKPLTKGDQVFVRVFGSGYIYVVVNTTPGGIIRVNDLTKFELKEEPVKGMLVGVPTIAYEDIGGLREQIQKVREMIELPMRHPELFRKLGIEPPKGVLLHGHPGTGKTLLAKAVANETNAHFISVNGPEIMCVDKNTLILTNPRGFETAGELFEEAERNGKVINEGRMKIIELKKPKRVYCLNNKLKISKGKITHLTKLKAQTFRVKTSLGDEFVVSSNQPFASMDSFGNVVWKTPKELSKNDLIAIAKTLPEGKTAKFDFLKDFNKEETWVKVKNKEMKLSEFKGKSEEINFIKIRKKKSNIKRSNYIKLPTKSSKELMYFLGLIYSEGNLQEDSVCFCNNDKFLKNEFRKLVRKLFKVENCKEYKDKIVFYSFAVRNYLEKTIGFPKVRKRNYSLPKWVFGLPSEQLAEFIKGFWEGDGAISKGTDNCPIIRIYASNKLVLTDLSILLRRLGIIAKIEPWNTKLSKMYALTLLGNKSRELFYKKIKSKVKKFKLIENWYNNRTKKGDDFVVPNISPLLKQLKKVQNLIYNKNIPEQATERYISGRNNLTQRKLEEISSYYREDKTLKRLINSEVSWIKVTEVVKENFEKELIDLTVEPFNNFLAGTNLVVMHNSKFVGEAEARLREMFKDAEENSPAVIFIDEIDAIAPKRSDVVGEVERRVVAQLLALMDGLEARGNVIVIAATNRVNAIDEALRRPGRFDREIEIGIPDKKARKEVLQIHTRGMPLKNVDLNYFASITHGFVGADLAALSKEAAMKALRRYLPKINLDEETISPKILESLEVNKDDFINALREVQPSALRELLVEVPNIKWSDIGGLDDIKLELKEAVEWPLKSPDSFKKMGIRPPKGILLYGPAGCGKTLFAKAVATESETNFISVKGPELISMWAGESEKGIRKIFAKARQVAPVVIFFDEIDSIAVKRGLEIGSHVTERMVNQLLTELDGVTELKNVVFIAATNRPDLIDPALLRPGRIDKIIKVGAPDQESRLKILEIHSKAIPLASNLSLIEIAKKTQGYSGADLEGLMREAVLIALKESKLKPTKLNKKHIEQAMTKIHPSISDDVVKAYDEFREQIGTVKPSYLR